MKFAVVDGQRIQAEPSHSGFCPCCNYAMTAKCGEVKVWHWAHRANRLCDPWWENETEWHRAWKGLFPENWQEVVHHADDGEKHIADVKTDAGWVIELQHSYIKPDERRSRDVFYQKLVWVVDGKRRKTDEKQFAVVWEKSTQVGPQPHIRKTAIGNCSLLREWAESRGLIFIDFGGQNLWWVFAKSEDESVYIAPLARSVFVHIYLNGATGEARKFERLVSELDGFVLKYEADCRAQEKRMNAGIPLSRFQQAVVRNRSARRRF
ncbi:MAG TPA: competence protein CoiA family protein [Steroidobacteraceae bacterium]|nr:competence protein CoiA family protein [Steroidobacteraceae bacterium]